MGVELWKDSASTPSLALPLQGGGDTVVNKLLWFIPAARLIHAARFA
jgi:hypothetical protein